MYVEIDEGIHSVLIVEDEIIVAMLMEDIVREMGVREVHVCGDSAAALEIVRSRSIDCAILDLWVRDGTTIPVADALSEKGVPFLFASGSDSAALDDRHVARPMISKPFLDDDLRLIFLDTWSLARSAGTVRGHLEPRVATFGATD